jgi:hypothetical protein
MKNANFDLLKFDLLIITRPLLQHPLARSDLIDFYVFNCQNF